MPERPANWLRPTTATAFILTAFFSILRSSISDEKGMQQQIDWAKGTERNNDMLASVALAKIARGELRSAREMFTQSWDALKQAGLSDDAAFSMAGEAVAEADLGNLKEAKKTALAAASVGRGVDARETAAEALALAGDVDRAGSLAEELHERFPLNRPLNAVSLPTIYATIELQRGNPQKAIDILQPAIPFDFCEFFKPRCGVHSRSSFSSSRIPAKTPRLSSARSSIIPESQPHPNVIRWPVLGWPAPS